MTFENYAKAGKERLQYLKKHAAVANEVKNVVTEDFKDAHVYLFGSTVTGKTTASSDIDILVVCNELNPDARAKIKAKVLQRIGLNVPVELHVISQSEFRGWYSRFVQEMVEV